MAVTSELMSAEVCVDSWRVVMIAVVAIAAVMTGAVVIQVRMQQRRRERPDMEGDRQTRGDHRAKHS